MNDVNPQPVDAAIVPRFGSIPTFMRLPYRPDPTGLDIGLVGVPWDGGTTNRAGRPPRAARDPQHVELHAQGASRQPHRALSARQDRRYRRCAGQSHRSDGFAAPDRGLLRPDPCQGRAADLGRRRSSDHLADLPRHREAAAHRHDPCRCPFRYQRPLFRRQSLHPRHALPPRGGGGAAGSQARDPDRHPRLDLFRGRHGLRRGIGHARRLYGGICQARAWSG